MREFRVGDGRYRVENRANEHGIAVLTVTYIASTGAVLPIGRLMIPLTHLPGLRRAIFKVLRQTKVDDTEKTSPANGAPWGHEEDATLLTEFDAGTAISEIAELHQRTEGAVETRLIKLGRLARSSWRQREERDASTAAGTSDPLAPP